MQGTSMTLRKKDISATGKPTQTWGTVHEGRGPGPLCTACRRLHSLNVSFSASAALSLSCPGYWEGNAVQCLPPRRHMSALLQHTDPKGNQCLEVSVHNPVFSPSRTQQCPMRWTYRQGSNELAPLVCTYKGTKKVCVFCGLSCSIPHSIMGRLHQRTLWDG